MLDSMARPWTPLALALLLLGRAGLGAQTEPPPSPLESRLREAAAGFEGRVGLYVRHLTTGEEVAWLADEVFPTASLVKIPILAGLFRRVEDGSLDYHAPLTYRRDRRYPGEDLLGSFQDGERIALAKLVTLMIGFSDNTASLWCQELAGTGTAINAWLAEQGLGATRVNSRTDGREEDRARFGWGQTTPREMANLLVAIRERRLVSPAASDEMARVLTRSIWSGEALSQIPPDVHVMSKQGAVSQSRSEVVLVNGARGPYVFCLITRDQVDTSWTPENAGYVLLRRVSRILFEHFEPTHPWKPATNSRFR